jgi:RecA-family ATPase
MKKSILSVALCLVAALTMNAQDVDKAKVTSNVDAVAKAGDDLKKLEDGEKAWKFDGTVGLNAAATGLVNWAAGGKNNVNGIVYGKLHLLYHKNAIAWETNFDTDFGLTCIDQDEDAF